jgi:CHASE2 domain-containing sensor protein
LYSGGYLEDLEQEKAQVIAVDIKRGQPGELTIVENELGHRLEGQLSLAISSFVESRFY